MTLTTAILKSRGARVRRYLRNLNACLRDRQFYPRGARKRARRKEARRDGH
jgi:hypothetical protein